MRNNKLNMDTFKKTEWFCPICSWELIDACGNFDGEVKDKYGETIGDFLVYCGNKSCENHAGVWYFQEFPTELLCQSKKKAH